MSRRTKKTPAELRVDLEAKLEAVKTREARQLAKDDPQASRLQNVYDSLAKDIAALSRQLHGPQSFVNRRKAFELRMAEIDAGEALAVAQDALYREAREYLKTALDNVADDIVKCGAVSQATVDTILEDIPCGASILELEEAYFLAHTARKAFTENRSQKNEKTQVEGA